METRLLKWIRCCPELKLPQDERECGEHTGGERRGAWSFLINTHA